MPRKVKQAEQPKAQSFAGRHIVTKPTKAGLVEYHYPFRGATKSFWKTGSAVAEGSPEYIAAFEAAITGSRPLAQPHPVFGQTVPQAVDAFRNSAHYANLKPRTKEDYEIYLRSFETKFRKAYILMLQDFRSVAEIRTWKEQWKHSPKMYDYATGVITLFLNWAAGDGGLIQNHHHFRQRRFYKCDRVDLLWMPSEVDAILAVARERVRRIIIVMRETGIPPQDLGKITRKHVRKTPKGRRINIKRLKNDKWLSVPVTPALAEVIDSTPAGQETILVSLTGRPLTPERASQLVRDAINAARALDPDSVREELHFYDMRGTAATTLLRAGCGLNEIAVCMGWGLRHASNIIEKYAALVPEVTDEVLAKLTAFWKSHHAAGGE